LLGALINLLNHESEVLQNLVHIFTILGVILGIVTLILTLSNLKAVHNQLKEMKLQRTHSQEPDLFVEPLNLIVDYQNEDILFKAPWRNNRGLSYGDENLLPITVSNIGIGVAKYVSLNVSFEMDFLSELVESDVESIFQMGIKETNYGLKLFQFSNGEKYKNMSSHSYEIDNIYSHNFNYVNPGQSFTFSLDSNIYWILNMALYLDAVNISSEKNPIPRAKVFISYYDSFNNRYEKDADLFIGSKSIQHHLQNQNSFNVSFELNGFNRLPNKYID
jgi:hypothetical protein